MSCEASKYIQKTLKSKILGSERMEVKKKQIEKKNASDLLRD